jgi:hypothetical protein
MFETVLFGVLSIVLVKLSYEDWKTKLIDVPTALFSSGLVCAAYLFSSRFWEMFFWGMFFMIASGVLKPYCEEKKFIGAGDISILSFLLPAAWFINQYLLAVFLILFGLFALVAYRKDLVDMKEERPLVPIITVAWVLTWVFWVVLLKA